MDIPRLRGIKPSPGIKGVSAYSVPKHGAPTDLMLDKNEGEAPPESMLEELAAAGPDLLRRYPDASVLQNLIAKRFGVDSRNVIVTAGADDALDRLCRALLAPGRELLTTNPGFEMLPRYARAMGADVHEIDWPGDEYPADQIIEAVVESTALVGVVSPNNPTGAVISRDQLERISERTADEAVLLCDFAYIEFADDDLTDFALGCPNTIVIRTLSKAWSCAGLRVGYAIGPEELIAWMRASGGPYAIARPSIALACARLEQGEKQMRNFVQNVRNERAMINATLQELGAEVSNSQANFVYVRSSKAQWIADALAGQGISIRSYPEHPRLHNSLRISLPGEEQAAARLDRAIRSALSPEFLIFGMDGVLSDITYSIWQSIELAANKFGLKIGADDITKSRIEHFEYPYQDVALRLIQAGSPQPIEPSKIQETFLGYYRGNETVGGMREHEELLYPKSQLEALAERIPLAIVTSRLREDTQYFLQKHGIEGCFRAIICREDAPDYPDPGSINRLRESLSMDRGWLIGEGLGEIRAARAANLVPLGCVSSRDRFRTAANHLIRVGAARVLDHVYEAEDLLP